MEKEKENEETIWKKHKSKLIDFAKKSGSKFLTK